MTILKIMVCPSGKFAVLLPVQSPALCDLRDRYGSGYTGYRSDYRDEITGAGPSSGGYVFDDDTDRLNHFISEAQPMVDAAESYLSDQATERKNYEKAEQNRIELEYAVHQKRISADAENIKNIGNFTGGKKIIFTIPTQYNPIYDDFWVGKTGICWSRENVSPNAIRTGNDRPRYYIGDNCNPISGNSNRSITRYFGWRGTTSDISIYAHGVRMVEKIVQFKDHARIYISKYDRSYTDN